MKLLEKEELIVTKTREALAPRRATRPAARPVARPAIKVEAHVLRRTAPRTKSDLGVRAVFFVGITGFIYVSSTLAGYVALERTRQSSRHGMERATYARQEAKAAREAIESLTNPTALRAWADSRGFVAGQVTVPQGGGGLVARL